jgi:hypothetical protein
MLKEICLRAYLVCDLAGRHVRPNLDASRSARLAHVQRLEESKDLNGILKSAVSKRLTGQHSFDELDQARGVTLEEVVLVVQLAEAHLWLPRERSVAIIRKVRRRPAILADRTSPVPGQVHCVLDDDIRSITNDLQPLERARLRLPGRKVEYAQQQYGRRPTLFRPPGGAYSNVMRKAVADAGLKAIITWEAKANAGQMDYQVGNVLRPGDIVLMHFRPEFAADFAAFRQAQLAAGLEVVLLEEFLRTT